MERKPGGTYLYLAVLFSLLVLAYSLWVLYSTVASYQEGQIENFYFGVIASFIGMGLAISSLAATRKRIVVLRSMASRTLTTVLCEKCGFKMMRLFSVGDYVHKEIGKCQQCDGTMTIASIYAEEAKKKSR